LSWRVEGVITPSFSTHKRARERITPGTLWGCAGTGGAGLTGTAWETGGEGSPPPVPPEQDRTKAQETHKNTEIIVFSGEAVRKPGFSNNHSKLLNIKLSLCKILVYRRTILDDFSVLEKAL
jgi:hypothetical protein